MKDPERRSKPEKGEQAGSVCIRKTGRQGKGGTGMETRARARGAV